MNNVKLVLSIIELVHQKGGEDSFAIFNLNDPYFVQFAGEQGANEFHCEVVSNNFLAEDDFLSDAQMRQLNEMGWLSPDEGSPNFYFAHPVNSVEDRIQMAEFLYQTAVAVFQYGDITDRNLILNME